MPVDIRWAISAVGDARILILYMLGYVSCVGVLFLLCKRINQSISIKVDTKSFRYIVVGEYAASFVVGSAFWYYLIAHPVLLWIPITLFLIISL